MKFLSKTIGLFVILFSFTAIFTACKSSTDDDPEAQVPRITSISSDVSTVVNIAKEISVGVEISDSGKLSYQWYVSDSKLNKGNPEENGNEAAFTPKTENAGTFYYYCEVKNTLDSSVRSAISPIIIYKVTDCINAQAPALVQQPEDVTASFGDSFSLSTFSYSTDGGTLSYQWFFSADKDKDAASIPEATKAAYTGTVSAGSLGYYYCVITNTIPDNGDGGEKTASTKTETVKLSSTQIFSKVPVILQQPQNLTLDFGNKFTFSVAAYSADGGTLSYQWYYKATENDEAVAINDATTPTYTGTVSAKTIGYYYCLIENTISDNGDGGIKTATLQTNAVILSNDTIEANKPVILTQPQGATLHVPEKTLLSVSAYSVDKGKLTYQWHKITGETDEAIENATESSYEVIANKVGTTKYYCTVTNTILDNGDGGLKSAVKETDTITITVDYTNANEPVITTQPEDVSAVIPAVKVFQIGAYTEDDGVLTYQWYSVAEGETEGTPITDENKSKLIVNVKELGKTGYYCVVTNTIPDNGDGSGKKQAAIQSKTAWLDAIYLKEVISAPVFIEQPAKLNIAPYNQSIKISCNAKAAEGSVSYRWYESTDGTTDKGVAVSNATTSTLTTPKYTEKGIYYYYCVATNVLAESEENIKSACAISDVISVAYTGLPTVYVNTPDSVEITSKDVWTENATISLTGAEDSSWNFDEVKTSIRGRGNSTWVQPKKPYALKLDKKQKIMGMPKHKRWVLIANYLDNSFMRNEMAFYLSETFELDYTVRGKFVDLVLNGEYKGLYWLGEAIKPDENRVNINDGSKNMSDDEDKDYLIEMDVYYDEAVKFKSSIRNMPYMIKNDDYMIDDNNELTAGGQARLERLQEKITNLEKLLYPDFTTGMNTNECKAPNESYADIIDIDSWVKFWFVNEIMNNQELWHPKSCYFTFDSNKNLFKAGPVWDFDWAALSQASSCSLKTTIYYNALFKSPAFKKRVKELWLEYYSTIDIDSRIESMRSEILVSQQYDTMIWGEHKDPSGVVRKDFDAYVDFLKETLLKKLSVVNNEINGM
ncbi:CotH kinase family protein [uncultured Treponema sp.]|uniref:CotH kinase family protein n=1 Tax=uncultured Treponema sp. TaxID=162155 RepID=UPI0025DF9358|nr:CotH kinase family protein [uncultured Treponema sp.]